MPNSDINISQGSAAICLRCGSIFKLKIYYRARQQKNFENQLIFGKITCKSSQSTVPNFSRHCVCYNHNLHNQVPVSQLLRFPAETFQQTNLHWHILYYRNHRRLWQMGLFHWTRVYRNHQSVQLVIVPHLQQNPYPSWLTNSSLFT